MRIDRFGLAMAGTLAAIAATDVATAECSARSGPQRTALVELYTSEGCSSCPPADRWLSGLRAAGIGADAAIPLAFHVDYWNKLGWPDRFSHAAYSERQRLSAQRNRLDFVYTPQFIIDGRDTRVAGSYDALKRQLALPGRERASIELSARAATTRVEIVASANLAAGERSRVPELFVAVTEDGLSTQVAAGENAGRRLRHDAVVRALLGPVAIAPDDRARLEQSLPLSPDWNRSQLALTAFVQDRATGEVLQALALPICR
jgi:hypothetical protein